MIMIVLLILNEPTKTQILFKNRLAEGLKDKRSILMKSKLKSSQFMRISICSAFAPLSVQIKIAQQ